MLKSQKTSYAYIIRSPNDNSSATCVSCNNTLTLDNFYYHSTRSDGWNRYRPKCKECRRKGPRTQWSRPKHEEMISKGVQECSHCKETKPLNKFYSNGCFKDGVKKYRTKCIDCVLTDSKKSHKETYKEKIKIRSANPRNYISGLLNHASQRKKGNYNLDLPYLIELYEKQNGKCAISGRKMTHIAGEGRVLTNISIDRINNDGGYTKGNVQLVCFCVNMMKQTFTTEDLLDWCRNILEVNYGKNSIMAKG